MWWNQVKKWWKKLNDVPVVAAESVAGEIAIMPATVETTPVRLNPGWRPNRKYVNAAARQAAYLARQKAAKAAAIAAATIPAPDDNGFPFGELEAFRRPGCAAVTPPAVEPVAEAVEPPIVEPVTESPAVKAEPIPWTPNWDDEKRKDFS